MNENNNDQQNQGCGNENCACGDSGNCVNAEKDGGCGGNCTCGRE